MPTKGSFIEVATARNGSVLASTGNAIVSRPEQRRGGWLRKMKAQSNLRGFIQACCKGNHRTDLLDALGKIKETKQGKERRKPKPFTEEEIENLLAKVPVVFADDPEKIPSHQTMIRLMVS